MEEGLDNVRSSRYVSIELFSRINWVLDLLIGNGKTISLKATMKTVQEKGYNPLYVKSFTSKSFMCDSNILCWWFSKYRLERRRRLNGWSLQQSADPRPLRANSRGSGQFNQWSEPLILLEPVGWNWGQRWLASHWNYQPHGQTWSWSFYPTKSFR